VGSYRRVTAKLQTTSDLDDLLARLDRHTTDHQEESSFRLAA
jgi:hypothetical protein